MLNIISDFFCISNHLKYDIIMNKGFSYES